MITVLFIRTDRLSCINIRVIIIIIIVSLTPPSLRKMGTTRSLQDFRIYIGRLLSSHHFWHNLAIRAKLLAFF